MAIQLDFFTEPKSDIEYLRDELKEVRETNDKVRKSLFARHNELARKYIELHDRFQILERHICKTS